MRINQMPRTLSQNRHRTTSQAYRDAIRFMGEQRKRLKNRKHCTTYRTRRSAWRHAGENEETLGQIQHMVEEGQLVCTVRR